MKRQLATFLAVLALLLSLAALPVLSGYVNLSVSGTDLVQADDDGDNDDDDDDDDDDDGDDGDDDEDDPPGGGLCQEPPCPGI